MMKFVKRLGKTRWLAVVAVIVLLLAMGLGTLVLLGPQTGQVFSQVTKGLGGPPPGQVSNPTPAQPSQSREAGKQPSLTDRKIIRNATLSLSASDVNKTFGEIRALTTGQDGLFFQSNTTVRDDKTYINVTLQVPSDSFDNIMIGLRRLSDTKVDGETTTGQDVTEEYTDLQAQIANLKVTEAQLQKLIEKAGTVGDILNVQKELSNTRGQIDQLQGRVNFLDKKSDMATIAINLAPLVVPPAVKPEAPKGWDALSVLDTAWQGSLKGLRALFKVTVTVAVWAVWVLPLLAIPYLIFRRMRRRRLENGTWPN